MARSNEFTHGGSVGKNLALLLRALLNSISFALLWFGMSQWGTAAPLFKLPSLVAPVCTLSGAALTVLCLVLNLIVPLSRRVK